jgi:GT2 family glycosyltransferase
MTSEFPVSRPAVSIIVPYYNKAPYLTRCLRSIARQTFRDFEVIVVDDGSTDGGIKAAGDFAEHGVQLIRQANAGPGAARNRGIAAAGGRYLAFLDADDEWLPDFLARGVQRLDAEPADVAAVASGYFLNDRSVPTRTLWERRGLRDGRFTATATTRADVLIRHLAYLSPCTTIIRSSVVAEYGGFFDQPWCRYGEDAFLFLAVLLNHSVWIDLEPATIIHAAASSLSARTQPRGVEPFLVEPDRIRDVCPDELQPLLSEVLVARAHKTACVLAYWGDVGTARSIVRRFPRGAASLGFWSAASHLIATPAGAAAGRILRMLRRSGGGGRTAAA